MNNILKIDKLRLILHQAGWSIGDTAFAGNGGIIWPVYGTKPRITDPSFAVSI